VSIAHLGIRAVQIEISKPETDRGDLLPDSSHDELVVQLVHLCLGFKLPIAKFNLFVVASLREYLKRKL
jgi:hypothetical protein